MNVSIVVPVEIYTRLVRLARLAANEADSAGVDISHTSIFVRAFAAAIADEDERRRSHAYPPAAIQQCVSDR